jgi:hypothetical protein
MTIVIELRAHRDHQCAKISATDRATVVADLVTLSASIRDIVERTVELSSPSLLHLEQATTDWLQLVEMGEVIPRALEEQHKDLHIGQVLGSITGRFPSGVQREREKGQTSHTRERGSGLCLGRHAPAKGASSRNQWQVGCACSLHRCPDRGMGYGR